MDYKILKITELCEVPDEESGESLYGKRTVFYEISGQVNLIDALTDYEENFDSSKIIDSYDDFKGGCVQSTIVSASIQTQI